MILLVIISNVILPSSLIVFIYHFIFIGLLLDLINLIHLLWIISFFILHYWKVYNFIILLLKTILSIIFF